MFNIGGGELIVIMLIALVVLGPERLPTAARQMGKAMSELRRLSSGFQNEVRTAFEDADDPDRVAARRNVLAKESRVGGATAGDGGETTAKDPSARPVRRTPLQAAPEATEATPKNGARVPSGTARTSSRATAATDKAAVKKAPAKKAAAKKAPSKGNKRTSS